MIKIFKLITIIILLFLPIRSATFSLNDDYKRIRHDLSIKKILSNDIREEIHIILYDDNDKKTLKKLKIDIINGVDDNHLLYMEYQRKYYNIPKEIYYRQLWQESTYNPNAKSHMGAIGYMQVLPSTFNWVKDYLELDIEDINNPYDNIKCGAFLMRHLKNRIDNRYPNYNEYKKWKRTLSSYNAGYSVHNKALRDYTETKQYVEFILGIYELQTNY
jgi:hypothetical protein